MTLSDAAAALGRKGGKAKSDAKAAAARANGRKGGRPKLSDRQIDKLAAKFVAELRAAGA